MDPTGISTQVSVKHCSLCQGDTEYYCYKCQQDLCIQCKKLHVIDLSTKHHTVTSYVEKMKYPPKQIKSSQSQDPKQVISERYQNSKQIQRRRSGDPKQATSERSQDPDNDGECAVPQRFKTSILNDMDPTGISTQVGVKHCSLCQGDTEYYCYKCQQDLCIQCKKLHVIDLSTKHHTVTSYVEKMKYSPKQVKSSQSQDPKQVISARYQNSKPIQRWKSGDPKQAISKRSQDPDNDGECASLQPVKLFSAKDIEKYLQQSLYRSNLLRSKVINFRKLLLEGIGHNRKTVLGQSKLEMRGQELKDLIDIELAGDLKDRCIIQKARITNLLRNCCRYEHLRETVESSPIKFLRIMTQIHSPQQDDFKKIRMKMSDILLKGIRLVPPGILRWSANKNPYALKRLQYSDMIYQLGGETIYYRSFLLEGLRHDRITGHKAVTIRGQSKAEKRAQGLKDLIDEVLAGDLEDRCIIQKTRMTRHMTKLLRYYHRYEQLRKTMEIRPFNFLRIMTRKHSPRKDDMKPIINMLVNLMKEIRLVPSGIPRRAGVEDLLTLLSSPLLQKSLSVTGVKCCYHISWVTQDRVWVSDVDNLILTDTKTGNNLHGIGDLLGSGTGIHTVNCWGELIYIDKERNIIKLCNDMKTTTTLIKHTDTTWEPECVYCTQYSENLLVGIYTWDTDTDSRTGKVMRYDNTWKFKHAVPHNDNKPHRVYREPQYITENNNGDVLVSDLHCVVVTSGEGVHRFSYTGPPPSVSISGLFRPRGICTDVMSHILVSDLITDTVQMLDRDGQFLSYLLTRQTPGMDYRPQCLSYDVNTHAVWVGSDDKNTMSRCRYINRHLHLTDIIERHGNFEEEQTLS